jgi:lipoate-protein ligase A
MWIDDQVLKLHTEAVVVKAFVPRETCVVLGNANREDDEVCSDYCRSKHIPVLRRYGGGGTVVLYPGCVVVTVGCWVKDHFHNGKYFSSLNRTLIQALSQVDPKMSDLSEAGISDIVYKEKKIVGTSMFRSRNYLLYQASIIVGLDLGLIQSCLKHPSREPEYRKKRAHKDFLSSLKDSFGQDVDPAKVADVVELNFIKFLDVNFGDELILPIDEQMKSLEERLERSATL